jgi:hypothetical protein
VLLLSCTPWFACTCARICIYLQSRAQQVVENSRQCKIPRERKCNAPHVFVRCHRAHKVVRYIPSNHATQCVFSTLQRRESRALSRASCHLQITAPYLTKINVRFFRLKLTCKRVTMNERHRLIYICESGFILYRRQASSKSIQKFNRRAR